MLLWSIGASLISFQARLLKHRAEMRVWWNKEEGSSSLLLNCEPVKAEFQVECIPSVVELDFRFFTQGRR